MYTNKKYFFPKSLYEPQQHNQMKVHLKGFHMTYWTPYNIGYWHRYGRNGVSVRFALMPPYENNNAQKWWDNFFEASYHVDAGDSEQVQWLYLKPRHSRARIWPINHAKWTSRGRTMALNAEGLNLKQKRPFHRRAQTVYWPYLWGIIIFSNIWKCLHVKLIKLYHSEVSNKKCKYSFG